MQTMNSEMQKAVYSTAKHEMGHWVAAYYYGHEAKNVCVKIHKNGEISGYSSHDFDYPMPTLKHVEKIFFELIVISRSGLVAQYLDNKVLNKPKHDEGLGRGGVSDLMKMSLYTNILRCMRYSETCGTGHAKQKQLEILNEAMVKSQEICRKNISLITAGASLITSKACSLYEEGVEFQLHLNHCELEFLVSKHPIQKGF